VRSRDGRKSETIRGEGREPSEGSGGWGEVGKWGDTTSGTGPWRRGRACGRRWSGGAGSAPAASAPGWRCCGRRPRRRGRRRLGARVGTPRPRAARRASAGPRSCPPRPSLSLRLCLSRRRRSGSARRPWRRLNSRVGEFRLAPAAGAWVWPWQLAGLGARLRNSRLFAVVGSLGLPLACGPPVPMQVGLAVFFPPSLFSHFPFLFAFSFGGWRNNR